MKNDTTVIADLLPVIDDTVCTYLAFNEETQQAYVGSTNNKSDRIQTHKRTLKNGTHHNRKLQQAYNQNPNFDFHVVPMETRQAAAEFEAAVLNEHWGHPQLLNIGRDVDAPFLGRTHTEEAKAKMAAASKGNKHRVGSVNSPESIAKGIAARAGYQHSDETKARIGQANSEALMGRTLDEEHRAKVVVSLHESNTALSVKVMIDGVIYNSVNEAARQLGMNPGTVHCRINSANVKFATWSYVK